MWPFNLFKKVQKAEEKLDKIEEAFKTTFSTGAAYNASISAAMTGIYTNSALANQYQNASYANTLAQAQQWPSAVRVGAGLGYYSLIPGIVPTTIKVLDICSGKEIAIPEIIEKVGYEECYYKIPAYVAKDCLLAGCYYVDADGVMRLDKELLEACMSVEIVR